MATFKKWMLHFGRVSKARQTKLKNAMAVLESDSLIKKEFKSTGLFNLKAFMNK